MLTTSFLFGGDRFKLISGSTYVNRKHSMVIKALSKPPNIERYYELAALIPNCMLSRVEAVELHTAITSSQGKSKKFGIMMPYIRDLKSTCSFLSESQRLSLYLQIIDTLMAALPSFDVCSECSLASVFWWRKGGKLVVLNPMRLFRTQRGTFEQRLVRFGRMMEKVDCVIAQSPGDTIFELLVDLKQSIRFHQPREQMELIQGLTAAVKTELYASQLALALE